MLVNVTDGDLADHDARLEGKIVVRLPGHDDHAQAIAATFLVIVVEMLFDDCGLVSNQTLSHRTIDEGGRVE